jgi:uncharacterized membrane protein YsdA (DUF1294 family)
MTHARPSPRPDTIPSSPTIRDLSRRPAKAKVGAGTFVAGLFIAGGLMVLPVVALYRLHLDLRWVGGYVLVINALTYWTYARDKRRAEAGEWRVPEAQLHLMELLGGFSGAWIIQRCLRHKTSKTSYQIVFWLIVLVHQFAAFDSLRDWQFSRAGLKWVQQFSERRK